MKMLGYVRVSSVGQADNTSIDNQIKEIKQYCKNNNHSVKIIKDVASGKDTNREGYNNLLDLLPLYDGIIAFKLDRLSRDTIDTLQLDKMIKKTNKQLIIINDGIGATTSTLELTIRSVIAQEERKAISLRTIRGKINKKSDGYYVGGQIALGKTRQVTDKSYQFKYVSSSQTLFKAHVVQIKVIMDRLRAIALLQFKAHVVQIKELIAE